MFVGPVAAAIEGPASTTEAARELRRKSRLLVTSIPYLYGAVRPEDNSRKTGHRALRRQLPSLYFALLAGALASEEHGVGLIREFASVFDAVSATLGNVLPHSRMVLFSAVTG